MKISLLKILSLGAATLAIVAGAPAEATTINLIDTGGVAGSPAAQGFALAARYWESVLTNNATINIQVGFQDLGPQVLGGTRTSLYTYVPMESYYGLLDSNENKTRLTGRPSPTSSRSMRTVASTWSCPDTMPVYRVTA